MDKDRSSKNKSKDRRQSSIKDGEKENETKIPDVGGLNIQTG